METTLDDPVSQPPSLTPQSILETDMSSQMMIMTMMMCAQYLSCHFRVFSSRDISGIDGNCATIIHTQVDVIIPLHRQKHVLTYITYIMHKSVYAQS